MAGKKDTSSEKKPTRISTRLTNSRAVATPAPSAPTEPKPKPVPAKGKKQTKAEKAAEEKPIAKQKEREREEDQDQADGSGALEPALQPGVRRSTRESRSPTKPTTRITRSIETIKEESGNSEQGSISPSSGADAKQDAARQRADEDGRFQDAKQEAARQRADEDGRFQDAKQDAARQRADEDAKKKQEGEKDEKEKTEREKREADERATQREIIRQQEEERQISPATELPPLPDYESENSEADQPEVAVIGTRTARFVTTIEHAALTPTTGGETITRTRVRGSGNPDYSSSLSLSKADKGPIPDRSLSPALKPPVSPPARSSGSADPGPTRPSTDESVASPSPDTDTIGIDFNYDDSKDPLMTAEFRSYSDMAGPFMTETTNSLGRVGEGDLNVHDRLGNLQYTESAVQNSVNSLRDNLGVQGFGDASIRGEVRILQREVADIKKNLGGIEDEDREQHVHQKLNWLDKDMKDRHAESLKHNSDRFDKMDETLTETAMENTERFNKIEKAVESATKNISSRFDKIGATLEHEYKGKDGSYRQLSEFHRVTQKEVGKLEAARWSDSEATTKRLHALEEVQRELRNAQRAHRDETNDQFERLLQAITSNRKRKRGHDGGDRRDSSDSRNSYSSSSGDEDDGDGRGGHKKSRTSTTLNEHAPIDTTRPSTRENGIASNSTQGTQDQVAQDTEVDHEMPLPPAPRENLEMSPPPALNTEKRSFAEVDGSDDTQDRNGSLTKKPRTQSSLENDSKETSSESAPKPAGTPTRKRAKFRPRPEVLHRLTAEEKEAERNKPASEGKKSEYSVGDLIAKMKTPVLHPYTTPRPGLYGSLPVPVPPPPPAALQGGQYPPPGPNVNIVYGGHEVADFGDSELRPETPPRLTSTGRQRDGAGEYSPVIPAGHLGENGNRAPIAPMFDPRPTAPTAPVPGNTGGMPPLRQGAKTTPTTGRPRIAPSTPVAPRPSAAHSTPATPRTHRTPRPPPPPGIPSTENKINNFRGSRLPHVDSPKKKPAKPPRSTTFAPSTLRTVRNASTLSSPSTVSSLPSPGGQTVPVSPRSPDPDHLDFNSSDLELDSEIGGPDDDYTEYPPDDSQVDLNADEITLNLGNQAGHFFHPFNPHTEFDDGDEDAQDLVEGEEDVNDEDGNPHLVQGGDMYDEGNYVGYQGNYEGEYPEETGQELEYGQDWGDEDVQGSRGPNTPSRTAPRDGTILDPVVVDEGSDDDFEVELDGIDDDSMFNDEAELERARKTKLKEEKAEKEKKAEKAEKGRKS